MENNNYFDYGYPDHIRAPHYGLFFPPGDCFLLVLPDQSIAYTLKAVLSSRYVTVVTLINTADNYEPNIIDNLTCTNWSASNKGDFNSIMSMYNNPLKYVKQLVTSTNLYDQSDIDLVQEQQWVWFCWHWIKKIYQHLYSVPNFIDIDREINGFLKLNNLNYKNRASLKLDSIQEILKILYLERDLAQAEKQINSIGLVV